MDYVDLYLMHWPFSWEFQGYDNISVLGEKKPINVPIIDTWRAMECLVKGGKARSIGVSNFTIPLLKELLDHCEIPPAVNQVELHPRLAQVELVEFCKENNIMLTAFSPVGSPNYRTGGASVIEHPVVQSLAEKYNKSPVQVVLNWGLSRGYCVIPKSKTPSRIKENLECYFKMEPQDVDAITALGENNTHRILYV